MSLPVSVAYDVYRTLTADVLQENKAIIDIRRHPSPTLASMASGKVSNVKSMLPLVFILNDTLLASPVP